MANLLDIRRRIRSVRNTQQITKAMKAVSAARLRRAQERVFNARPYSDQLRTVLGNLAGRIENVSHPLLEVRPERRVLLVVVTADRGLCGAFNANIIRIAQNFLLEHREQTTSLILVGRKGRDFFKKRASLVRDELVNFFSRLNYGHSREISAGIVDAYAEEEVDAVYLIYNEFKSVLQQRLVVERLLPIIRGEFQEAVTRVDYIYEQPPQELFQRLLPRYIEIQVYRALLESSASEQGARMTAMDAATNNAGEMIEMLTLNMNRVRQASITREIIEVVSGSGAL